MRWAFSRLQRHDAPARTLVMGPEADHGEDLVAVEADRSCFDKKETLNKKSPTHSWACIDALPGVHGRRHVSGGEGHGPARRLLSTARASRTGPHC